MAFHWSCSPFSHALPTMMTGGREEVKHRPPAGRRASGVRRGRRTGQPWAGEVTRLSTSHASPTFCMVTVTWSR